MNPEFRTEGVRPVPEFIPLFSCPAAEIKDYIDTQFQDLFRSCPHQLLDFRVTFVMNCIFRIVCKIVAEQVTVPLVRRETQRVKFVFQPDGFRCFAAARKPDHQMKSCHECSCAGLCQTTMGKWIEKQVPSPGTDSNDSEPSYDFTIAATRLRPSPLPGSERLESAR